jgi:hypothetical protein
MVIGPCSVKFAPSTDRVSRLILNRHPGLRLAVSEKDRWDPGLRH